MNAPLLERVKQLAQERAELSAHKAALKEKQDAFDNETRPLRLAVNVAMDRVAASELSVRTLAVEHFNATQETQPAPGIGIRVSKVYGYDQTRALAWAKETKLCLVPESLDEAALFKIAAVQPLEFVTVTKEASATITKDLEKALATADVTAPETQAVAS